MELQEAVAMIDEEYTCVEIASPTRQSVSKNGASIRMANLIDGAVILQFLRPLRSCLQALDINSLDPLTFLRLEKAQYVLVRAIPLRFRHAEQLHVLQLPNHSDMV